MLLRLTNMRGLDLAVFDFDHDLAWTALMLNPQGKVLGRYGNPGKGKERGHDLDGLRFAMTETLRRFDPRATGRIEPGPRVEEYSGAARFGARACFHCHHVRELQREEALAHKAWSPRWEWRHPPPETIGIYLDRKRGNRVVEVARPSPAARSGLKAGDDLVTVNGVPIAAAADLRFALDRGPFTGAVSLSFRRGDSLRTSTIQLPEGWKEHDVSWRWSLRMLKPDPPVRGDDLEAEERRMLGLPADGLAFRQWPFVGRAAQQAGIQAGDVIVGFDGKSPPWSARRFEAYLRMYRRPGDRLVLQVLRDGKRRDATVVLGN